tara:strand:+ start:590 stop:730 length:141 start_codon:yes stop_codon:yes gene_type:complete
VEKFCGRVSFAFDSYNANPRKIYEIPAVAKHLRAMTDAWLFWHQSP